MQVAVKFVPTNIEINDSQCLVKLDDNGVRIAKTRGGKISRTGLTITPSWTEEGSIVAHRSNSIPDNISDKVLIMFDGHGTDPKGLRAVSSDTWKKNVVEWDTWRTGMSDDKPTCDDKTGWVFHQARSFTRVYRNDRRITDGEADSLSRYPTSELIVYQKDGDILEVIKNSYKSILAYRWIYGGTDKAIWKCFKLGSQSPFEEGDWEYTFFIDFDTTMVSVKRKNVYTQEVFGSEAEPVHFTENWHHLKDGPWTPITNILVACEELEDGTFVEIAEQ